MGKVTIEDISRRTGLSRGTVSRALNDRPDISEQTKQKVLEACRQLNYVPSHAARSLATGRSFAMAVLVDDLRSAFSAGFLRGVILEAQAKHYAVYVTEVGGAPMDTSGHVHAIARERVDGLLVTASLPAESARGLIDTLEKRPLVCTTSLPGVDCDTLTPDQVEAGRLVGRRMLRHGQGDVLYVHDPSVAGADARLAGFHEICSERQVGASDVTIEIRSRQSGDPSRMDAVSERLRNVRAVAASDDFLAMELMIACQRVGRAPGRDIAVIGQGNELFSGAVEPSLTSIDFSAEEIGRRAMDLALQRATNSRQDAAQRIDVAPVLIERATTACLASS